MTTPYDRIKQAVIGNPPIASKQPSRQGVVRAFAEMQAQLEGAQAGAIIRSTLASLNALAIAPYPNIMAWVMSDPVPANNGIYQNAASAESPIWVRRGAIPQFLVTAMNAGAGTVNALKVTTDLALPSEDGRALIVVPVLASNTATGVTIQFNDSVDFPADTLEIVSNSGSSITPGGLAANSNIAGFIADDGTKFRLLSDQASAAILAQVEAARDETLAAMSSAVINSFTDRATAEGYAPAVAPEFIGLAGEYEKGDGGQALYARQNSEPADEPKFFITLSDGVSVVWYAPAYPSGYVSPTAVDPHRIAIIHRATRSKNALLVSEQGLSTAHDRTLLAIEGSKEGDQIIGHRKQVCEINATDPLVLKSGTTFRGNGMLCQLSEVVTEPVRCEENGNTIRFFDLWIDGGSKANSSAFAAEGVNGLEMFRTQIKGWPMRAIDLYSSADNPIENVSLFHTSLWSPLIGDVMAATGLGHPIIARSGMGGLRGKNIWLHGGNGWGTNPLDPSSHEWVYTSVNTVTADFIVFQGIIDGGILDFLVNHSGRAGISVTRGSENILIARNTLDVTHEPGVNVGSGYELVHVDDLTGFYALTEAEYDNPTNGIRSTKRVVNPTGSAVTGGRVSVMVPDVVGLGGWIGVEATNTGIFEEGDTISQLGGAAPSALVTVAAAGEQDEGYAVIYSAYNIKVIGNKSIDTNIPVAGSYAHNFIRSRGETLMVGNSYDNPRLGTSLPYGNAAGFCSNSHSRIGLGAGNTWNGRAVDDDLLQVSGAYEWLFKQTDVVGFVARAAVSSAGNVTSGKGLSAAAPSPTGTFALTFTRPMSSSNYDVIPVANSASHYATWGTKTTTGFEVLIKQRSDNTAVDGAFTVTVIK